MRQLLLVLVALLVGCSSSIDAEDYARQCSEAAECQVIFVGDICDCSCEMSAINVADYPRYQDDRSGISCSNDCGVCPGTVAVCRSGVCEAEPE